MSQSRIVGIAREPAELRRLLRDRAEQLNISRETIDDLACLPDGYSAKLLCEPPVKEIGPKSLWPMLDALGLAFIAVVDERRMIRVTKRPKRKFRYDWNRHSRNAKALSMMRRAAVKNGFLGGKARLVKMTPQQRSLVARHAAMTRWRRSMGGTAKKSI